MAVIVSMISDKVTVSLSPQPQRNLGWAQHISEDGRIQKHHQQPKKKMSRQLADWNVTKGWTKFTITRNIEHIIQTNILFVGSKLQLILLTRVTRLVGRPVIKVIDPIFNLVHLSAVNVEIDNVSQLVILQSRNKFYWHDFVQETSEINPLTWSTVVRNPVANLSESRNFNTLIQTIQAQQWQSGD